MIRKGMHRMTATSFTNRVYKLLLVFILCAGSLVACKQIATQQPSAPKAVAKSSYTPYIAEGDYTQSAWLDDYASAHDITLPPVNERLPSVPVMANIPGIEIGTYTGEEIIIDDGPFNSPDSLGVDQRVSEWYLRDEPLMMYAPDGSGQLIGNVFQMCEIDEQYKTYTFTMREGLRWSDGALVTTEDVRFMIEDCWAQEAFMPFLFSGQLLFTPSDTPWFTGGDKNAETIQRQRGIPVVNVLDELHFQIQYEKPFYQLATLLTQQNTRFTLFLAPSAYLKQFHPFYADTNALGDMIARTLAKNKIQGGRWFGDESAQLWVPLDDAVVSIQAPTLGPWMVAKEDGDSIYLERNPYYWKVDAHNQQLPYIDRIRLVMDSMQETPSDGPRYHIRYGFAQGIKDYAKNTYEFAPMQAEGKQMNAAQQYWEEQQRDLTLYQQLTRSENMGGFRFMLGAQDSWWQKLVKDTAFRKALCLAVDGEQLAQAEGGEYAMPVDGWTFDREMANALLDQVLPHRDANNYRTWDGSAMVLRIVYHEYDEQQLAAAEVYAACFEAVGVQCELTGIMPSAEMRAVDGGGHIAAGISLRAFQQPITYARQGYLQYGYNEVDYLGYRWHETNGAGGREPLAETKTFYEKLDALMLTPNVSINAVEAELNRLMLDGVLCYPGIQNIPWPVVADSRIVNIPNETISLQEAFRMAEVWFLQ